MKVNGTWTAIVDLTENKGNQEMGEVLNQSNHENETYVSNPFVFSEKPYLYTIK